MFQDDKYEQHPHSDGRHGKETGRYDLADMVAPEGSPGLVRRPPEPAQDARHEAFGDGDAEHLQLAMNPGCGPQRVDSGHLRDQAAELCDGGGATSASAPRFGKPGPESAEPFALPMDDGVGLNVHQRMSPARPLAAQSDPKYSVPGCEQRALPFSSKRCDLHS
jgi:hypothetical protein